uniref:DUF4334 domain-containing protein n=1 Tax=Arcella intermedia TaxID=1963864 RepID=A0A6B2LPZ5_9EUKA|eukprot:TRINITY_DN4691_c0_g1_i1.p1 TRINITY_DN4691_c0_g1~~TRINITY_DN4691_c0_g1_i1.p1  ORF type:complete len:152 (+),score=26.26 TRINITY_DN4691_c0_g1_i1:28-456(+)
MIGNWKGAGVPTGHPADGLLEATGWWGKWFETPETVHPLVFGLPGSLYAVNPVLTPWALAYPTLFKSLSWLVRPTLSMLRTTKPKARLRMTEFRGVTTATMIYDDLPVNDIFRRVDNNTLLGLMDQRGSEAPNYFFFKKSAL